TTYLSLAGRYCVLMPNTDRGGGISRKITSATDRKRLRGVVQSLDVPKGMGLIVRTAGAKRTKAEIKRDYDYLERTWEAIREKTLHSIAPALIYEEEDLVKRAIRDLYDKDIDGIWVEGEGGYKEARDFMRMLMPAQAKKVQAYREPVPLFVRHRIEDHLSQIYSPVAPLKSGGYLVINQTEALVAIDVNSGRATRERNIEATALKTNMEAAEEACRQLRLRDLAGLVVIDFIDMEEAKNNRAVEKRLKDCLKDDRARIQMGKISSFGLMELSRQRRRTGILEGTTHVCPHCQGAGRVRSTESSALSALRAVEMEGLRGGGEVTLRVSKDVGLYILNAKRDYLVRLRQAHGLLVNVALDEALAAAEHQIDRISSQAHPTGAYEAPVAQPYDPAEAEDELIDEEFDDEDEEALLEAEADEEEEGARPPALDEEDEGRRRGRRRRRRGRRGEEPRAAPTAQPQAPRAPRDDASEFDGAGRRRRRGRRGGRRMREEDRAGDIYAWSWPARPVGDDPYQWRGPVPMAQVPEPRPAAQTPATPPPQPVHAPTPAVARVAETIEASPPEAVGAVDPGVDVWVELPAPTDKPARARRRGRGRAGAEPAPAETVALEGAAPVATLVPPAEPEPEPEPEPAASVEAPVAEVAAVSVAPVVETVAPAPQAPDPNEILAPPATPRRGWWRRGA
ncbi:MAG TPA: Rne/Rng family ribonuclease, partial [Caulobacteraceae bacterium]|nr:Rne/Rng family ribonuclease [Caulobacteraceae bacterium]